MPITRDTTGRRAPIAVFDSGLGGLTVVAEIRRSLPAENIVYFGDTARVPYGTKSVDTVTRFALECSGFLLRFDPKLIVAACNTASAFALDALRDALPVPVCGVVEPGAAAAVREARCTVTRADQPPTVAVLATEATVASGAYRRAIRCLDNGITVSQQPCPLLVPLIEEGRLSDDRIALLALEEYLAPLRQAPPTVALLGCTHYPLLEPAIAAVLGPKTAVVDSARATADAVALTLADNNLLSHAPETGILRCCVSDNPERFAAVGSRFLGSVLDDVAWIPPDELVLDRQFGFFTAPSPHEV